MLVRNLSEFVSVLEKGRGLLGIDYGTKIIGIAVADPLWTIASPVLALERRKFELDAKHIAELAKERTVGGLVVGLPRTLEGGDAAMAQAARAFIRNLFDKGFLPDMPVLMWDERFSTAAVERFLIEEDISRKRRSEVIDKVAAAYILQGCLDAMLNLEKKTLGL